MCRRLVARTNFPSDSVVAFWSLLTTFACCLAWADESQLVRLDGRFKDWSDKEPIAAPSRNNLIRSVRITVEQDSVFLAVDLNREIEIQKNNPLTLLADTDQDPATGLSVGAIGADVQYNFGSLEAIRHVDGVTTSVPHPEIGIIWAPTFSSDRYEIALPLELFGRPAPGRVFALAVAELPDIEASAVVVSGRANRPDERHPSISLEKPPAPHVRILTMNVLQDGLFEKPDTYERIFRALEPDILLLSEVYSHSADQVIALLDESFPAQNSEHRWYGFGRPGKVTISRYPFMATDIWLDDLYTVVAAPGFDRGLFVIHTHLECCENDEMRQEKVTRILENLRASREDSYSILYRYPERPLVLSGDLNLVGKRRPYDDLVGGITADFSVALTDASPKSPKELIEAISYHTNSPYTFTWQDDKLKWPPGKLDFTFITVPDLVLGKSFVLYTPDMDPEELRQYGLRASDSIDASDHLPHIIDIAPGKDVQILR